MQLNETHDPALRSWVESANSAASDFPIQNLPFGVFRPAASGQAWRGCVAIGDQVIDLVALAASRAVAGSAADILAHAAGDSLNPLMKLGSRAWSELRLVLSRLLREGAPGAANVADCLIPRASIEMTLPASIGDYTDFYTSIHHATNVGRQFRPDNPLLPNYKWVPIGYHGRSSSIRVSGAGVVRPRGQVLPAPDGSPVYRASERLDIELELGAFIGGGNPLGRPIPIDQAEQHLFGLVLLNDWSARDIQPWEYQPLGPFLSKNFATTVSPWIVTMDALAPYRRAHDRPASDPQPLPHLDSPGNRAGGALDIDLEVHLQSQSMRDRGQGGVRIAATNYRHAYWTLAQLVTHHTSGGCNLQSGDLLGTGTLSGPTAEEAGSLLELTQGGKLPLTLPHGETRTFLQDGDVVVLRASARREGMARIGFGECRGLVLPPPP